MSQPVTLSKDHVLRCLQDDRFYELLPEFLSLKPKMEVGRKGGKDGCGGCSETTRADNLVRDFGYTLLALREPRLAILKKHLGVEQFHLTAIGKSGKWESRVI